MDLDAPKRVVSGGGVFFFDDDRETPDTQTVTFDFEKCSVVWEHRIWAKTGNRNEGFGVELIGEKGTLVIDSKGWHVEQRPGSPLLVKLAKRGSLVSPISPIQLPRGSSYVSNSTPRALSEPY